MRYSDVLDRLQRQEDSLLERLVVAPTRSGGRLRIAIAELIWECHMADPFNGWGLFRIGADRRARLVREATFLERETWARRHSRYRVVLLEPGRTTTRAWCDELEREVIVLLADGIEAFETVLAAWDGARHWSIGLDPTVHPSRAARMRERFTVARWREADDTAGFDSSRAPSPHLHTTQRIAAALAFAEAELVEWRPDGRGYLVTWRKRGRVLSTWVNDRLGIENAGLCLSGLDAEHDLVSLASLIDQPQ